MFFKRVMIPGICTNCYIIADENSSDAVVVDPGVCNDKILNIIISNELNIKYFLFTHGHFDHTGGLKKLKKLYPAAKIAIGVKDEAYLFDKGTTFENTPIECEFPDCKADVLLCNNDVLKVGEIEIKVISTPGHTKGGVSYLVEDILISGDTLFKGTIGRTDFAGGDFNEISESLKILSQLPDETRVYPGHGFSTSIIIEKETNPFMK